MISVITIGMKRLGAKHAFFSFNRLFSSTTDEIFHRCESLYQSILPLNHKLFGPLEDATERNTAMPFVFLLGNHSSGKSSFINYLLGKEVQATGVAPTDDGFTIIAPGPEDVDQDGQSFVGDPDLGFSGLRPFGPTLVHHVRLKVRKGTNVGDFMVVDSPGMIDSPSTPSSSSSPQLMDRGYDFEGVVKWFSERADLILLFFDPDKPGTTGETLTIYTNALAGMHHKYRIILNKADQFKKMHDFARIHTMCLPPSYTQSHSDDPLLLTNNNKIIQEDSNSEELEFGLGPALKDLTTNLEEVISEVHQVPQKRVHNLITRLHDASHLLRMHARMLNQIRGSYRSKLWRTRVVSSLFGMMGCGIGGALIMSGLEPMAVASITIGVVGGGGMWYWGQRELEDLRIQLVSSEGLQSTFNKEYSIELSKNDESISSTWYQVKEYLSRALINTNLNDIPTVSRADIKMLDRIIDHEVPSLRRDVSPEHLSEVRRRLFGGNV